MTKYDLASKELSQKINQHGLIYLTGSQLTGVATPNSDVDFYTFKLPTKRELLLLDNNKGTVIKGDGFESKTFSIIHLIDLLQKVNPNVVEFFFKKPIFVSSELEDFANLLWQHKEDLPYLNQERFVYAAIKMMSNNIKRMKVDKEYLGSGSFGKEAYNFLKAYSYAKAIATNQPLEGQIFLQGQELEKMKQLKGLTQFNQNILNDLQFDTKMNELKSLHDNMTIVNKPEVLNDLIDSLPIYY